MPIDTNLDSEVWFQDGFRFRAVDLFCLKIFRAFVRTSLCSLSGFSPPPGSKRSFQTTSPTTSRSPESRHLVLTEKVFFACDLACTNERVVAISVVDLSEK